MNLVDIEIKKFFIFSYLIHILFFHILSTFYFYSRKKKNDFYMIYY